MSNLTGWGMKAIEKMTRKEKLLFVTHVFARDGEGNTQTMEIRCSRGVSTASYLEAERKGMRRHNQTLNERLAELGYVHQPSATCKHHILKGQEIVFTGQVHEVWDWINQRAE